jgi:hypothetical protein
MNAFDLFAKRVIIGGAALTMLLVRLVVVAAERKPRYLAGFRN